MHSSQPAMWLVNLFFSLGLFSLCTGLPAIADSPAVSPDEGWPQWRGPGGFGISLDKRVPLTWSETHNLVWKTALQGAGNSTPIVWGDRIFLTESHDGGKELWVVCLRVGDGKVLWRNRAAQVATPPKTHEWNGHASPSCTTDGKYVYAFFGTPGLFCYDLDGHPVWKHVFGIFTSETGWGVGASPFLFEDLVIQNCDNDGPQALPPGHKPEEAAPMALVALDKKTGEVRWQTKRDQGRGFSTPVLTESPAGRTELLLNGPHGIWSYEPRTGKEIWHCERHKGDEQALFGEPLPVFDVGCVYVASGRPGPLQAINRSGQGDVTKSHILWEVSRKGSRDVASPILSPSGEDLHLADRYGMLTVYDTKTGKVRFKERLGPKPFVASPVLVRGKLLYTMEDGTTYVLEPGPELKIVGRNRLNDGTEFRASPAIADGRLFLRSQAYLYCIAEKG